MYTRCISYLSRLFSKQNIKNFIEGKVSAFILFESLPPPPLPIGCIFPKCLPHAFLSPTESLRDVGQGVERDAQMVIFIHPFIRAIKYS